MERTGILEIWEMIVDFVAQQRQNGYFEKNRKAQNRSWFLQTVEEQLKQLVYQKAAFKKMQEKLLNAIDKNEISPFYAAKILLKAITKDFT